MPDTWLRNLCTQRHHANRPSCLLETTNGVPAAIASGTLNWHVMRFGPSSIAWYWTGFSGITEADVPVALHPAFGQHLLVRADCSMQIRRSTTDSPQKSGGVFGFPVGDRTSTGYSPPEWARVLYGAVPPQDVLASPAFDVWCAAARWARGRPCIAQVST